MILIICSGVTETNPGPKKYTTISFCYWNLNGIAAHKFSKVSLLQAMATTHECRKSFLILRLTRLMTELILKDTIF